MNKKDFYRQIMENYTIDTDKIKCNAKRKAMKQKNAGNVRRWITGAGFCAAAAAVVVVSLSIMPKGGIDIREENPNEAIERVYAAESRYQELLKNEKQTDMYVSFENKLSLNEILIAFSSIDDNNEIKISLLYTPDGKCYKNSEKVNDNILFLGAKITAPINFYKELNSLKSISLAEFVEGNKYNDKSFVPYISHPESTSASVVDKPVEIDLPNYTTAGETNIPTQSTIVTSEPSEIPGYETTPSDTEPDISGEPIEIPVTGVKSAEFISSSCLIVTTEDSVRLYRINGGSVQLDTTFYASNAKIAWSNRSGTVMFITACDGNGRNKLFYADGNSETLSALDVSSITSGADIASVLCSDDGSVILIKTVTTDKSYIYYAQRSESGIVLNLVKEYGSAVSVLTCSNGRIYTAVTDAFDASVKINCIDTTNGQEKEIASFGGTLRCTRNKYIDTAFLTVTDPEGNESCKILTPQGNIIDTEEKTAVFSDSYNNVIMLGDKYYRINNDMLTEITAEEAGEFKLSAESNGYTVNISEDGTASIIKQD